MYTHHDDKLYFVDMERDVKFFQQQLGVVFDNYISRSNKFLDDNITILKPAFLLDEEALQKAFSSEVLLDLTHPIEDVLKEVSAVVEKRARTQAEAVGAYIGTRPSEYSAEMLASSSSHQSVVDLSTTDSSAGFQATRLILQERLQRDAKGVLETHNSTDEAKRLTDSVKRALYQVSPLAPQQNRLSSSQYFVTASMQVAAMQTLSAATVGALVTAHMLDLTGVIVSSTMAASSLFYLPYKKTQMK